MSLYCPYSKISNRQGLWNSKTNSRGMGVGIIGRLEKISKTNSRGMGVGIVGGLEKTESFKGGGGGGGGGGF